MAEPTRLTVREITSYPFRLEGETEDGRAVLISVRHDEAFITLGDVELHATIDPLDLPNVITPAFSQ